MSHVSMLGRLKEQDPVVEWVLSRIHQSDGHFGDSLVNVMGELQQAFGLATQKYQQQNQTTARSTEVTSKQTDLHELDLQHSFLELNLHEALTEYDRRTRICSRRFVPPTFKEIRHILNVATAHAAAPKLRMITLDADDTVYEDGGIITMSSPMVSIISRLLQSGVIVALVTAAGYPNDPKRYEQRLAGLLNTFQMAIDMGAPADMMSRFLVMGGECNYLHRTVVENGIVQLQVVPGDQWKNGRGVRWTASSLRDLLDCAEKTLRVAAERLGLDVQIIRKERAVGLIRRGEQRFSYETLEEVALTVQDALQHYDVPHCAFNGGNDVWVDVGNKALGIRALQSFANPPVKPEETIHVGDRFTRTGNDMRAREVASSLWISNPAETQFFLRLLLADMDRLARAGSIAAHIPTELPSLEGYPSAATSFNSAGTFEATTDDDEEKAQDAAATLEPGSLSRHPHLYQDQHVSTGAVFRAKSGSSRNAGKAAAGLAMAPTIDTDEETENDQKLNLVKSDEAIRSASYTNLPEIGMEAPQMERSASTGHEGTPRKRVVKEPSALIRSAQAANRVAWSRWDAAGGVVVGRVRRSTDGDGTPSGTTPTPTPRASSKPPQEGNEET